ncbi:Scr1 family TA system antitoxin-like transcriptional regulator [Actinomadura mexicana]|uniref:DUF5753 domain-containing protein n=1 Tax=Actinomadura mexicana TaxID=134959 RepID=A0A238X1Z2_9ACTN|nr:hypothetical protein SAMN06265355_103555 [Actinomadura mexicana]
MAEQIDHLICLAQLPHVQIRVIPFSRITPVALVGLLSFEREADLLYFETGSVGQLVDREDDDPQRIDNSLAREQLQRRNRR